MNTKKWLTLGLSVALAGCLGWAVAACAPTEPNPNEGDNPSTPHTHTFTGWDHSETEHWRVCPDDGEIDVTTRAPHVFVGGECECGMKEADITPDEGRDTRSFWVVGSGAGDLSKCSFTELKSDFKLTKQPKKDANGYTVYTTSVLTLYAGDTMKIVQDLDWDDGLGYFGVTNIKNNDGSLVDGGGPGNITPAKGKDGKYIFTVRTKPDIAFSQCTLEFTFVEPVEPLKNNEEIYIVGNLAHYKTQWPKGGSAAGCLKLNYDEATGEWSIVLRLGGKSSPGFNNLDEFKLYNAVNGKYIPDGTGNNWNAGKKVSGVVNYKESGDYKISWKSGDTDITFTLLPHEHNFDDNRMARDENQHWAACWLDDTQKPDTTREDHLWENNDDTKCDKCGYTRHVHKYEQTYDDTQHWMECPTDHAIDPEHPKTAHTIDPETHTCECGYEQHTHEYTKWEHDAKQHWKVCPKDNEVDPETPKAAHSFDPDTHTCECGYEHTHSYTRYNYNDREHWKECPTDDVIDEETRAAHTFDQAGNKCVCGAVNNGCAHDGGVDFEYTAAPETAAEGGTLQGKCKKCGEEVDVPYNAALEALTSKTSPAEMPTDGTAKYFTKKSNNQNCYIGFVISAAGTYTINFQGVYLAEGVTAAFRDFLFDIGQFGSRGIIYNNLWKEDGGFTNDISEKIRPTLLINGETPDFDTKYSSPKNTFTITFTVGEEDLTGGNLYVTTNYYWSNARAESCGVLVSCTKSAPAAASVSAPAEVALLPDCKH